MYPAFRITILLKLYGIFIVNKDIASQVQTTRTEQLLRPLLLRGSWSKTFKQRLKTLKAFLGFSKSV